MADGPIPKGYQHWCTPPEVVETARRMLGAIDLDPFSNKESRTYAMHQWTTDYSTSSYESGSLFTAMDGWGGWPAVLKTVFVNPPWLATQKAIEKCRNEWLAVPGRQVIGLFPAGCNSSAWPIVLRAPARCFPHKRITFWAQGEPADQGADKNVVIVYWGHDPYRFREVFRELGEVVFG